MLVAMMIIFGIRYLTFFRKLLAVDHTTCPHRHTSIQLRNVSHNQSYQVFGLFCLRGIRRGLGVTTDRLFGIHTSLHLPYTSPSHPFLFQDPSFVLISLPNAKTFVPPLLGLIEGVILKVSP